MKQRHSEEQITRILREAEAKETPIKELCRRHGISEQTLFRWRNKYGGIYVAEARRLKELESEVAAAQPKKLTAPQGLRAALLARTTVHSSWRSALAN